MDDEIALLKTKKENIKVKDKYIESVNRVTLYVWLCGGQTEASCFTLFSPWDIFPHNSKWLQMILHIFMSIIKIFWCFESLDEKNCNNVICLKLIIVEWRSTI